MGNAQSHISFKRLVLNSCGNTYVRKAVIVGNILMSHFLLLKLAGKV